MMRLRSLSALSLLSALALFGSGCENYHGRVEGTVEWVNPILTSGRFNGDARPMRGIQVVAKSLKDDTRAVAWTDCNGYYRITRARFGPNQITTVITASRDGACPATAFKDYFEAVTYVDVQKDETAKVNLEVTQIPDIRDLGITVRVEDALTGAPLRGAKTDLYTGLGNDYSYVATLLTDAGGIAVFYPFEPRARFVTPIPSVIGNAPLPDPFYRKTFHHRETTAVSQNALKWYEVTAALPGYVNASKQFLVTYDGPSTYFITLKLVPGR